ncbi:MAG: hypothetical protein K2X47_11805, partial [Bdellovibrionales bacterium]|nr:hypothetical protein [Bdellovibrionales bacterium]
PISPLTILAPVNLLPVLSGGLSDAKVLLPNGFNVCGNAIHIPDTSLAGVFPNRNFVELVRLTDPSFLTKNCN